MREANRDALDAFLRNVQRRAVTAARLSVPDEDALDCVQDAMISFATRYAKRPQDQWRPLFFKILYNRLKDWHRRRAVRQALVWVTGEAVDAASPAPTPDRWAAAQDAGAVLIGALEQLPMRQQQAFLLRVWEGMNTREAATAMSVDEGTVKTHLSRATHRLREATETHYEQFG